MKTLKDALRLYISAPPLSREVDVDLRHLTFEHFIQTFNAHKIQTDTN